VAHFLTTIFGSIYHDREHKPPNPELARLAVQAAITSSNSPDAPLNGGVFFLVTVADKLFRHSELLNKVFRRSNKLLFVSSFLELQIPANPTAS
jgi:hypothetical protein